MANDRKYLSAEEEAELLQPIDEYIDKIIRSNSILGKLVKAADMKDHLSQLDTLTPDRLNKYKPHIYKFIY